MDFSPIPEGWNGEQVECELPLVWSRFESGPGVDGAVCASIELRDPVDEPAEITHALTDAAQGVIHGGEVTYFDCSVVDDSLLYAFQGCHVSISDPDGSPSLINIHVYSEISVDDLRTLLDLRKTQGSIGHGDFDGIHSTANVRVVWGEEPE